VATMSAMLPRKCIHTRSALIQGEKECGGASICEHQRRRFVSIRGGAQVARSAEGRRSASIRGGGQSARSAEGRRSASIRGSGHSARSAEGRRSVSIRGGGQGARIAEGRRSASIRSSGRNAGSVGELGSDHGKDITTGFFFLKESCLKGCL
jgi:hypothetical protein